MDLLRQLKNLTLRKKILIAIGLMFICLVLFLYTISRIILLRNFAELEEQNTRLDVKRALAALFNEVSILDSINSDWAGWDDTYTFIIDLNKDYINTNMVDDTFTTLKLNFMIFINSSGKIAFSKGFDLNKEEEIPIPEKLKEHLYKDSLLVRHPDTKSKVAGIVLLPKAPLLISSRPILTSKDEGPIRGTLIMGRYLDSNEIESLARITQLPLTVFRYNDAQVPPDFQMVHSLLSEKSPIIVQPLNKHSIGGYALIKDIYGNPALILRVNKPRQIYKQGKSLIVYFILLFLAVGLVFALTTILILEKLVVSRIVQLGKDIMGITSNRDFSKRIAISGKDELSNLAKEINNLLETLERSLKERSENANKLEKAYRELKETQDQLIKSAKMASIGTLAAGVSHEINNPLNIILGFCQLLLDEVEPDSDIFKDLKKIEKHTRNCKRIVENLLQFARKSEMQMEEININKVVQDALDLVRTQFLLQNIEIRERLNPDIPSIKGDYNQLQQVFLNLFNNAGQAMPQGGVLTVETNYVDNEDKVSIQISDTGEGIKKEDLPYIFDPFFTTRSHMGGTGLGLSVSQGIIESHQGEIFCKSNHVEEKGEGSSGTTFTVILPVKSSIK